ncbi:MAG: transglutaminase family protein [Blastocatellia bacterium]|nr:transglutaminase family protein [Blastocatellia bacterium]
MVSYRSIAPERTGDVHDVMTISMHRFEPDLSDLAPLADDEIPLAHSVLRIALTEYPRLEKDRWLSEIDRLAERARARASGDDDSALVDALDAALFVEAGFHGNSALYYDPRNSFLNDVLERRTGIPITLSIVYIETGRRLGLDLFGIGLPGTFSSVIAGRTDVPRSSMPSTGARALHAKTARGSSRRTEATPGRSRSGSCCRSRIARSCFACSRT